MRAYHIEADGKEIFRTDNNYQRLVKIPVDITAKKLKLVVDKLDESMNETRIFSFEVK